MMRTTGLVVLLVFMLTVPACSSFLEEPRFRRAIENNDVDYIRQNISSVDINKTFSDKPGFLADAIKLQHNEIVALLILNGADCNLKNGADHSTPLQSAVLYDNPEGAELLLANGADPDQMGSGSFIAIVFATGQDRIELVEVLLNGGCNVNATDMYGRTALHKASSRGNLELVRLLLEYGAAVEDKDLDGKTPSELAQEAGHDDIVKVLKQYAR